MTPKPRLEILLIEPYFTGSHAAWARGYQKHSQHQVEILNLPGQNWKWRMHGGALTLSRQFLDAKDPLPKADLILASDLLDLTTFQGLTRHQTHDVAFGVYFHENQITYPWSPRDRDRQQNRDRHYGFINFASGLAADFIFFNSDFHRQSFLKALPAFLKRFPDFNELCQIDALAQKSHTLHLGLDLKPLLKEGAAPKRLCPEPVILWNHRWEYDKNPGGFFEICDALANQSLAFKLIVLGSFSQKPDIFSQAQKRLAKQILHWGYVDSRQEYADLLRSADFLPVTSNQDFFGASCVEAAHCGVLPLLPKRLAYAEVFSHLKDQVIFYDDPQDLLNRLAEKLRLFSANPAAGLGRLSGSMQRYDWTEMAPVYDQTFIDHVSAFQRR